MHLVGKGDAVAELEGDRVELQNWGRGWRGAGGGVEAAPAVVMAFRLFLASVMRSMRLFE